MGEQACTLPIINELGLHARAAARLAAIAQQAAGPVWLSRDAQRVDATSVIDLLTLACSKGSMITLEIDNLMDRPILDRMVQLIREGFGEI